jgi:DNA-binding NarL/FixJ family response regulator
MRASYLVVEDDSLWCRRLDAMLREWGDVTTVGTVCAARATMRNGRWSALVTDLLLPDGSGFEVVAAFHAIQPASAILVLTGSLEEDAINRACELNVRYAVKLNPSSAIEAFARSVTPLRERLVDAIDAWRARHGLSEAECDVLIRTALGESRDEIAAGRLSSAQTVKKQCTGILRKTQDGTLQQAVTRLLREVAGT